MPTFQYNNPKRSTSPIQQLSGTKPRQGAWLGAALAATGMTVAALLKNRGDKRRQQEADRQNLAFWNTTNKYNHPIEQMSRLKLAGLNPNLIYGQSVSGATGNAGSQPAPSKAAPYGGFDQAIPMGLKGFLAEDQQKNLKAQSINYLASAATSKSTKAAIDAKLPAQVQQLTAAASIEQVKSEIQASTKQAQINKIIADSNISQATAKLKQIDLQFAQKGAPKGNTLGIIMNGLGLDLNSEKDKKIFKGLVYTWFASGIIGKLSPALQSFFKKPNKYNTNVKGDQNFYK